MKINYLSLEWKGWIETNLDRGCSIESIVDKMIEQNFDADFSLLCVRQLSTTPHKKINETSLLNSHYLCEKDFSDTHNKGVNSSRSNLIQTVDREVRVFIRHSNPLITVFEDVLSDNECDELIQISREKLKRSTIVDEVTGAEKIINDRSSFGTSFTLCENNLIAKLDKRISALMGSPIENGKGIQVLNYKNGAEYKPHYDFFSPDIKGSEKHLVNGGQRISTLIMYLNNVIDGGETTFPHVGLTVTPKKGCAVYFQYCDSEGNLDFSTLHGGLPVKRGEKWIATKWMRQYKTV